MLDLDNDIVDSAIAVDTFQFVNLNCNDVEIQYLPINITMFESGNTPW